MPEKVTIQAGKTTVEVNADEYARLNSFMKQRFPLAGASVKRPSPPKFDAHTGERLPDEVSEKA